MSNALGFDLYCQDDTPMRTTLALADGLAKTLRIAKALLQCGRTIDLAGLDPMIGLLCARALDLPPEQGRVIRPELMTLRQETDELIALLAEANQQELSLAHMDDHTRLEEIDRSQ